MYFARAAPSEDGGILYLRPRLKAGLLVPMMVAKILGGYSVLISGRDETCRDQLKSELEPEGYETVLAGTGWEAVRIIKRMHIHVGIIDMDMPDMSGVETLELIEQTVEQPPPCILLSGTVSKELMVRALCAHAHTLLPKPLDPTMIRRVLRELILQRYRRPY